MTDYRSPTGVADEPAPEKSEQAKQEAAATKDEAKRQAGETAQTAKAEAGAVADEAKTQARNVVQEAKRVGVTRADEQTANVASALRQAQEQAQALLDGRADEAGAIGDYARRLTDELGRYADRVDDLGFEGIVRETSRFARRRPGMFLLAAAGTGLLVGRMGRGIKDAGSGDGSGSRYTNEPTGAIPQTTTAPTSGLSGTPEPVVSTAPEPEALTRDREPEALTRDPESETWTRDEEGTWR